MEYGPIVDDLAAYTSSCTLRAFILPKKNTLYMLPMQQTSFFFISYEESGTGCERSSPIYIKQDELTNESCCIVLYADNDTRLCSPVKLEGKCSLYQLAPSYKKYLRCTRTQRGWLCELVLSVC